MAPSEKKIRALGKARRAGGIRTVDRPLGRIFELRGALKKMSPRSARACRLA